MQDLHRRSKDEDKKALHRLAILCLVLLLILVVTLLVVSCGGGSTGTAATDPGAPARAASTEKDGSSDMNGFEAYKKDGGLLVDVREPDEFAAGHVPGAVNKPLSSIAKWAPDLANKETPLYLYCRSGARSGMAIQQLKSLGYKHLTNLGGVSDYPGQLEK